MDTGDEMDLDMSFGDPQLSDVENDARALAPLLKVLDGPRQRHGGRQSSDDATLSILGEADAGSMHGHGFMDIDASSASSSVASSFLPAGLSMMGSRAGQGPVGDSLTVAPLDLEKWDDPATNGEDDIMGGDVLGGGDDGTIGGMMGIMMDGGGLYNGEEEMANGGDTNATAVVEENHVDGNQDGQDDQDDPDAILMVAPKPKRRKRKTSDIMGLDDDAGRRRSGITNGDDDDGGKRTSRKSSIRHVHDEEEGRDVDDIADTTITAEAGPPPPNRKRPDQDQEKEKARKPKTSPPPPKPDSLAGIDPTEYQVVDAIPSADVIIVLPALSDEYVAQFTEVRSDEVYLVLGQVGAKEAREDGVDGDGPWVRVEFACGREQVIPESLLAHCENGPEALLRFREKMDSDASFDGDDPQSKSRRAKRIASDVDTGNYDDGERQKARPKRRRILGKGTSLKDLRSRSHSQIVLSGDELDEDDEDDGDGTYKKAPPRRSARQVKLTDMKIPRTQIFADDDDQVNDPREISSRMSPISASSDDSDEDFMAVRIMSDVLPLKRPGRPSKASMQARRTNKGRPPSEATRRSARENKTTKSMYAEYDEEEDDELMYVGADVGKSSGGGGSGATKAMGARETFKREPMTSDFASVHTKICDTCGNGSGSSKGHFVFCQGCSLSYHVGCLSTRQAREHMATKVAEGDFVLQCRFCIGMAAQKDGSAPRHGRCQQCRQPGASCRAFSTKKSSKQEEKLREDNEGVDPIMDVKGKLLYNKETVMFRCVGCKRGWHFKHLPSTLTSQAPTAILSDVGVDGAAVRSERQSQYAVEWQCIDCIEAKDEVGGLVGWRPLGCCNNEGGDDDKKKKRREEYIFSDYTEDDKEYLVRWKGRSYNHCSWLPGAWVFGRVAPTMRIAFAKRAEAEALMFYDETSAVPVEYLMPDVILAVRNNNNAKDAARQKQRANGSGSTTTDIAAQIARVSQILVKFKGLGYDDVVWDDAPTVDGGRGGGPVYTEFVAAFKEYLAGKNFVGDTPANMRLRLQEWRRDPFTKLTRQPEGISRGKLMEYQINGVNWLLSNYHAKRSVVLADEMGLGKTVQVVSFLTSLIQDGPRLWPFLVVVPNSTCPNWRREIKQWSPDVRVVTYHGGKQSQDLAYQHELFPAGPGTEMRAHVVVMSYDSAQDERTRTLFKSVRWQGLIVDEGQRLKNDENLLYAALKGMDIPFRVLMTGTPLQNNKRELFNLMQFIQPEMNAAQLDAKYQELNAENIPELLELIRPYFLRRTKGQVLGFLKPMSQIIVPVSMTVLQERLCKSIMAKSPELIKSLFSGAGAGKILKKDRGNLNNVLMQMRKCLCHPFMYSEAIEEREVDPALAHRNLVAASSKLILLNLMLPILQERGHRVLIFSQFLAQLDIIEDFLAGMGLESRRLDGSMSSLEKQRRIDEFNAKGSTIFAFLLSTRAGGVGINLATADTVIIMDPDFNPHQDMQALSRAHRIGQTKKVLCIQLMTKNSVEEKIMQVGRRKMALDHALIENIDDEDVAGDDLESILKHGAQALFGDDARDEIRYDAASVSKLLERSRVEEKPVTTEKEFAHARIWSNEAGDLGDEIDETEAPEVAASVWDKILAEREAEARRIADASRETLGRGGRRRQAINYRGNADEGDRDADSSDDDDEFRSGEFDADAEGDEEGEDEGEEPDGDDGGEYRASRAKKGQQSQSQLQTQTQTTTAVTKKQSQPTTTTTQMTAAQTTKTVMAQAQQNGTEGQTGVIPTRGSYGELLPVAGYEIAKMLEASKAATIDATIPNTTATNTVTTSTTVSSTNTASTTPTPTRVPGQRGRPPTKKFLDPQPKIPKRRGRPPKNHSATEGDLFGGTQRAQALHSTGHSTGALHSTGHSTGQLQPQQGSFAPLPPSTVAQGQQMFRAPGGVTSQMLFGLQTQAPTQVPTQTQMFEPVQRQFAQQQQSHHEGVQTSTRVSGTVRTESEDSPVVAAYKHAVAHMTQARLRVSIDKLSKLPMGENMGGMDARERKEALAYARAVLNGEVDAKAALE